MKGSPRPLLPGYFQAKEGLTRNRWRNPGKQAGLHRRVCRWVPTVLPGPRGLARPSFTPATPGSAHSAHRPQVPDGRVSALPQVFLVFPRNSQWNFPRCTVEALGAFDPFQEREAVPAVRRKGRPALLGRDSPGLWVLPIRWQGLLWLDKPFLKGAPLM